MSSEGKKDKDRKVEKEGEEKRRERRRIAERVTTLTAETRCSHGLEASAKVDCILLMTLSKS